LFNLQYNVILDPKQEKKVRSRLRLARGSGYRFRYTVGPWVRVVKKAVAMEPSKPDPNIKPDVSSDDREAVGPNGFSVEGTRFLRSILQNSSEIVKIVDPDGTLKYASPGFGRVLGYDPQETLGTNILDHVHPEDLPRVLAESESALSEGGIARNVVEYRFRHKDGSWRWLESVGANLLDEPGWASSSSTAGT